MKHFTHNLVVAAVIGAVSFSSMAGTINLTTVYAHGGHHGGGGHHGYGYSNPGNCNMGGSDVCYYYCDGHDAHLHENGVCPYVQSTYIQQPTAQTFTAQQEVSESTVMKVQKRLNELGYSCGTADGIIGPKTEDAIKKFKVDNGLKENSKIKKPVLKALGL